MILRDLVIGLLIAGAIAAWVPDASWQELFLDGHQLAAKFVGPLTGPLVAIASFVCAIGNVALAATRDAPVLCSLNLLHSAN